MRIHHGGCFKFYFERAYCGGRNSIDDMVDIGTFSTHELYDMVQDLCHTDKGIMFYNFKIHDMSGVIDEINEGNGVGSSSHSHNVAKRLFLEMFHLVELQVSGEISRFTGLPHQKPRLNELPTQHTRFTQLPTQESCFSTLDRELEEIYDVMATPAILVFAEENLGDPIDIRMDIIHPEPVAAVAFPVAAVVRTQAQHGEAIRGIQEQLLGVSIQEELTA
nr:hypothetical protein [Tanacetum cinerariifolium]